MPYDPNDFLTPEERHPSFAPNALQQDVLNEQDRLALEHKARGYDEKRSGMERVIDVIGRTQYATAGFAHELLRGELMTEPVAAFTSAFREAGSELLFARDRRSFADLIEEHAPGFYEKHGVASNVLGFIGDVALDPLTYVTFGTGGALKVGLKGFSKADDFARVAKLLGKPGEVGKVAVNRRGRKLFKSLLKEEAEKAPHMSANLARGKDAMMADIMQRAGMTAEDAEVFVNRRLWNASADVQNHVPLLNDKFKLNLTAADFDDLVLPTGAHIEHRALGRLSDELGRRLLAGDDSLVMKGGMKFAGKRIPLVNEITEEIIEAIGLRKLGKVVKHSKPVTALRKAFQRFPEEIAEIEPLEKDFYRRLAEGEGRVKQQVATLYTGMDKVSRHRIGAFMAWIDDTETTMLTDARRRMVAAEKAAAKQEGRTARKISNSEVMTDVRTKMDSLIEDYLKNGAKQEQVLKKFVGGEYGDAVTRHLGKRKGAEFVQRGALTPEELSTVWAVFDEMRHMAKLEQTSGILANAKKWYSPRYYDAIRDSHNLTTNVSRLRAGVAGVFGPNETRKFKTMHEAVDAGFDPVLDSMQLYALRASASYEGLARMEFNRSLELMIPQFEKKMTEYGLNAKNLKDDFWDYGNPKIVAAIKSMKENARLGIGSPDDGKLAQILEHVRFMGSPMFDPLDSETKNYVLRGYDKVLSLFRSSATVMRMAFGSRNMVSNQFQMYLGGGAEAVRHLNLFVDPLGGYDSAAVLLGMRKPSVLARLNPVRRPLGGSYTPEQFVQLAKEHNIVRNVAFEGVGGNAPLNSLSGVKKMTTIFDRERAIKSALSLEKDNLAVDGMTGMLSGGVNFWDFPAFLEDHSRLTLFKNLLHNGYDSGTAARMVDDALFDYTHGMSKFETRVMRRIIPFYSFQRFAAPLITRAMVKNPGRVANTLKAGKTLMRAWGRFQTGESLTPEERAARPDWLLSQPHEFAGWEDQFAKFNTFNNYLPLDVFSFVESDHQGNIDIKETIMRVSLSQITPIVKVPLEFLVSEDFFTGRDFESMRDVGEIDVDRLMGNMAALVTNHASQKLNGPGATFLAPAMRGLFESFAEASPDGAKFLLKTMIGYEEGVNRYGEPTAYMAPYRLHMATSLFPALNTAIKDSRLDKTPLERAYYTLFGIPTTKRDLMRDAATKKSLRARELQDKEYELKMALVRQQKSEADRLRAELLQLADHWTAEAAELEGLTPRQ